MDANMQEVVKSSAKNEHISGQWSLEQLFSILDGLTGHVSMIEKRRGRIKAITSFAFFFAVMGLVGSFVAYVSIDYTRYVSLLLVLGIVGFATGIVGAVLLALYKRKDFQDDYQTYLLPLLKYLEEDIKAGSPIAIDFYLSPIKEKRFSQGRGPKYKKGAYHSCRDYTYERMLLKLRLRLQDGNRLMLAVHERLIETKKAKRSSSGKYKTKTKFKRCQTFDIRVLVNPEKFSCAPLTPDSDPGFYDKERNGIPLIGMRCKESLRWAFERNKPELKPSRTLRWLVLLYARVQPKA